MYNCDCMELMKSKRENHWELSIVDPPYGIDFGNFYRTNKDSLGNRYKADKYKNSDWDNEAPDTNYFNALKQSSNEQIVWGGNYFLEPYRKMWYFYYGMGNSKTIAYCDSKEECKAFIDWIIASDYATITNDYTQKLKFIYLDIAK